MAVVLQIRSVPEVLINAHFFCVEEIEVDFAPQELQSQQGMDVLCTFLRVVGRQLGKPVVVTPEGGHEHVLVAYDVGSDRVVVR